MEIFFFFFVLCSFSRIESKHHQKHRSRLLFERGAEPRIPDLELPEPPRPFEDRLSSSTSSSTTKSKAISKTLLHPGKILHKIDEKLYREIDDFYVSEHNNFGCDDMLQIVFHYKDQMNNLKEKTGFLSIENPGFVMDTQSEVSCEHYKE